VENEVGSLKMKWEFGMRKSEMESEKRKGEKPEAGRIGLE
jgi:hypothetical protein